MVSSEEFSFPKISNPLPHFAISPSLWRVTSVVYPDFFSEEEEEEEHEPEKKLTRKSFSCSFETDYDRQLQENNRLSRAEEEKMDMLWENFNEELQRVSPTDAKLKHHLQGEKSSSGSYKHVRTKLQQVCCANNTESRIIYRPKRYNSFVMLVKVLKKIFLLQNSAKINHRR